MPATTIGPFTRFAFGRPVPVELAEINAPIVATRPLTMLAARVCLGAIFLVSGVAKLVDPAGAVGYMTAVGVPAAGTLVYVAGVAELLGALSIMTGALARVGALGLVVFLGIVTYYFHAFWDAAAAESKGQMVDFMKNLAILGGLLVLVATGAGRYAVDAVLQRRRVAPRSSSEWASRS